MSPSVPPWVRSIVSGTLAGGVILAGVVIAFGDVRHDASDAKAGFADHDPRLRRLESIVDRMDRDVSEMRTDVKELLRRTPPR